MKIFLTLLISLTLATSSMSATIANYRLIHNRISRTYGKNTCVIATKAVMKEAEKNNHESVAIRVSLPNQNVYHVFPSVKIGKVWYYIDSSWENWYWRTYSYKSGKLQNNILFHSKNRNHNLKNIIGIYPNYVPDSIKGRFNYIEWKKSK